MLSKNMEGGNQSECSKTNDNPGKQKEDEDEKDESDENNCDNRQIVKSGGSSSNSTVEEGNDNKMTPTVRPYVRSKMPRLRWTPDLHLRFMQAIERLGGEDRATPKLVLQLMSIKGLSIAHVKSHLQMYRSKKADDPSQVISKQRHLFEMGDCNIYNLSQLPVLQGYNYNPRPSSTFRYGDRAWSYHENWSQNPFVGQYSSIDDGSRIRIPAGRTGESRIFEGSNSNPSIPDRVNTWRTHGGGLGQRSFHDTEPWLDQVRPGPEEHRRFSESVNLEKCMALKRKSLDSELDLELSLKLPKSSDDDQFEPGSSRSGERCSRRSSNLALSLNLPSTWVKEGSTVDSKQKTTRTSTLDLTL
ncbi:hypothetical protein Ancab_015270 [Ancistrocladus abbreviatus]